MSNSPISLTIHHAAAWWPARLLTVLITGVFLLSSTPNTARAQTPDPAIEVQVNKLSAELRCLVCQNQSILDSDAELAVDLRNQIRTQLTQGRSKAEILDFMVARYGEFILYRPPFEARTLLLWLGPFALLLIAFLFLIYQIRARKRQLLGQQFTDQDLLRANQMLASQQPNTKDRP